MSARIKKRGNKWATTFYPRPGQRVWISGNTRQEVEDNLAQAIVDSKKRRRDSETVASFAGRWMRDYPRPKESTCVHYEERVARFVEDFGDRYLADIERVEARTWALENRGRWKQVRAMFSDAVRDNLAETNPFLNMRLGDNSRGRRDLVVPTPEEVDALCEQARLIHGRYGVKVFQHLIQVAAYTGMRPGELYGLQWGDIDFRANTVHVQRQYNIKVRKLTLPKNGLKRVIYLTPPAAKAFRELGMQSEEYVFSTARGRRYTGTVNWHYWTPVRNAIGRPDWDFYCLRHYYGTHLANLGLSAPDIAQALGHTDGGKLALERYIHVAGVDSRARIAAAFGSNVVDIRDAQVANWEQSA